MSLITKTFTFTVGATIIASEHNTNFDTLYNDYNGNITNSNISASAAIEDTKLGQITTTSKVSGAALTALANIPSAAGLIPLANIPNILQIANLSRDMSLASGTQALVLSGTSFTPTAAIILSSLNQSQILSLGLDDGSRHLSVSSIKLGGTSSYLYDSSFSVRAITAGGTTEYRGLINSFNAGGASITWTKVGSPVGTLSLAVGFLR